MNGFCDSLQDTLNIQQDIVIPEPQYTKTIASQDRITVQISRTFIVLPTVNFDDQARLQAREINDVYTEHYLSAETDA